MKNAFYFILKGLFVLQIFKFLSWFFGHVGKIASFDECVLFQVMTRRHVLFKFTIIQRFFATVKVCCVVWSKCFQSRKYLFVFCIFYIHKRITILLIPKVENMAFTSYIFLKSASHFPKRLFQNTLKMMKSVFYLILKAPFVSKIFKFLCWFFLCRRTVR